MEHIYFCASCQHYTLEKTCPRCAHATVLARPPKYSPDDKYAPYRREAKKEELQQKGLY